MEISGKSFTDLGKKDWAVLILPSVIRHSEEGFGVEFVNSLG